MIVADIKNIGHQISDAPALKKAIDFLRRWDIRKLSDGRVEIDGDRVFALVQRYETVTVAAPRFEYHRKYIDVQFIASGEEVIGWAPADRVSITEPYDPDKDICFGTMEEGKWTPVHLSAGQLAVLWPEDAHAPKLAAVAPSPVMKIVVKVAV
jgi:YhcH/YjgK/YiaL family protein